VRFRSSIFYVSTVLDGISPPGDAERLLVSRTRLTTRAQRVPRGSSRVQQRGEGYCQRLLALNFETGLRFRSRRLDKRSRKAWTRCPTGPADRTATDRSPSHTLTDYKQRALLHPILVLASRSKVRVRALVPRNARSNTAVLKVPFRTDRRVCKACFSRVAGPVPSCWKVLIEPIPCSRP